MGEELEQTFTADRTRKRTAGCFEPVLLVQSKVSICSGEKDGASSHRGVGYCEGILTLRGTWIRENPGTFLMQDRVPLSLINGNKGGIESN